MKTIKLDRQTDMETFNITIKYKADVFLETN